MWIYILSFIISICLIEIFGHTAYSNGIRTDKGIKFRYLFLALLPVIFIFLFRWNVGVDTNWYIGSYPRTYTSFLENPDMAITSEPVFYLIIKICVFFNMSYFWWLFVLGAFYLYSTFKFITVCSRRVSLSLLLFLLSDLYIFGFGALRQALAISFILLLYVDLYKTERKITIKAVIYAILAILSHMSSIAAIIIIAVSQLIKLKRKQYLLAIIIITLISPISNNIIKMVINKSWYGIRYAGTAYAEGGEFTISYFLIALCLIIVGLLYFKYITEEDIWGNFTINHILFFYLCTLNSAGIMQMFRVVNYFMPIIIIAVPNWIRLMKKRKNRFIISILTIVPFIFMFCNIYIWGNGSENYKDYMTVFQYWSSM